MENPENENILMPFSRDLDGFPSKVPPQLLPTKALMNNITCLSARNYACLAGLAALLLVLNGCLAIPVACKTRSTGAIGARVDDAGKVHE